MENYLSIAEANTRRANKIIEKLDLSAVWGAIGGEVRQVGSMRMGLLAKHRDIDFHIYTDRLDIEKSFAAMARLAADPAIRRMEYGNMIDTEERCIEWHAWYADRDGALWQLDMIQIERGSRYDGYFERVADRITARLNPEMRDAILRLKFETPDTEKIMGIEYYMAVLRDGVRTYPELTAWRQNHPAGGVIEWMP